MAIGRPSDTRLPREVRPATMNTVDSANYARFLPAKYQEHPLAATSTWWDWRGRRVHIARSPNTGAPMRVLGIHGAGGYAGALWPFAAIAAGDDAELAFPDLPLYGDTVEPNPGAVRYETWIDLLCDLVVAERRADDRPLLLFGASMGGMLAYEVAARTGQVAAIAATCLLDPSDPDARRAAARFSTTGMLAPGLLCAAERIAGDVRIPVRWLANIRKMSLQPALSHQCATDPKGGGVHVPLGLLTSFMTFHHAQPEAFDAAPVMLVHPAADQWTPPELSIRFLNRINGTTSQVLLDGCGHFPVEEPGITQLAQAMRSLRNDVISAA